MEYLYSTQDIKTMKSNLKIVLIEDEKIVRESLSGLLSNTPGLSAVGAFHSVESYLEAVSIPSPDVILLDIGLKDGMSGLSGLAPIKKKTPNANIIMLTTFDDSERIFKALCGGAAAYLTKRTPFPKIAEAIHTVSRGGSYMSPVIARKVVDYFAPKEKKYELTPRQNQIVEGIMQGLSYKLIADQLMISTETVRDHIKKIYRKLEVNSKTELIKKKLDGELG